jgi:hypothetical protein
MVGTTIRVARSDDAPGILAVLAEVAPEIPLLLDTTERRQAVSNMVTEFTSMGESWVAVGANDRITGFLLVESDEVERRQRNNQALHLHYAGVTKIQRNRGIFRALVQQAMNRNVPLSATVKAANQSEMTARLTRIGFQKWRSDSHHSEDNFRWQP